MVGGKRIVFVEKIALCHCMTCFFFPVYEKNLKSYLCPALILIPVNSTENKRIIPHGQITTALVPNVRLSGVH